MSLPKRPGQKAKVPLNANNKIAQLFDDLNIVLNERENDSKWQKSNLEYDIRSTEWISNKIRSSNSYAQNVYAALCNNEFQKKDNWCILSDQNWSCSWRYAGGIIADVQEKGDYIDWYCSGVQFDNTEEDSDLSGLTDEQKQYRIDSKNYVGEGVVTDEVRNDLNQLGWVVLPNEQDRDL